MLRKILIFGLGGLALALAVWAFYPQEPGEASAQAAARTSVRGGLSNVPARLCRPWRWFQTQDDYQGGTYILAQPGQERWLRLQPEGRYQRFDEGQLEEGYWTLDEARQRLALRQQPPTARQPWTAADYRHRIERLNDDTLVLAWQGRHGWVHEHYVGEQAGDFPAENLQ